MQLRRLSRWIIRFGVSFLASQNVYAIGLSEAYERALIEDKQFESERLGAESIKEEESIALSRLLPNVSVRAHRFENDLNTKLDYGTLGSYDRRYASESAVISLTQPIYRPREYAGLKFSKAQVRSSEAELFLAEQNLILRLTQAYLNVGLAYEEEAAIMAERDSIQIQLDAAKKALVAGQGTRTDIDDASARLDLSLADLIAAQQKIISSKRDLSAILNQEIDDVYRLDVDNFPNMMLFQNRSLREWIDASVESNPELAQLLSDADMARADVERAKAGHKPTLDLVLQRTYNDSDDVTSTNTRYINNQVGVQLNLPLFAGGGVSAEVRKASRAMESARAKYDAGMRTLTSEVEKEFLSISESSARIKAYQQALLSAEQAVISNKKGVLAGVRSRVDILDAERKLAEVRYKAEEERVNFVLSNMRLLALAGALNADIVRTVDGWLQSKSL